MAKSIQSLLRSIDVLTYLNKSDGANSSEVASATKLPRGTAYRILETLEEAGLVEYRKNGGGYWLTGKVLQLSAGFDGEAWVAGMAIPEMNRLCQSILWPVMLTTARETEMMLRATTDSISPFVRARYILGHTIPMLGSAAGRCYLGYLSESKYDATLSLMVNCAPEPWREIAKGRTALDQMRREVRKRGFAIAESNEGGTISIAVPILNEQHPLAILGARYYTSAMTIEQATARLVDPLKEAAGRISGKLSSRSAESQ